MLISHF